MIRLTRLSAILGCILLLTLASVVTAELAPMVEANGIEYFEPNYSFDGDCSQFDDSSWIQVEGNAVDCGSFATVSDGCGYQPTNYLQFFADFLNLRPRGTEVAYAVPVDGPVTPVLGNGIQIGRTASVDQDYQAGWRAGFILGNGGSGRSLMARWTRFESENSDAISIGAPDAIRSLVTHPLGRNEASDGLQASANYDIEFDAFDIMASIPCLNRSCGWTTELLLGARYADLSQGFRSSLDVNGSTVVNTDIDFRGAGPQLGLLTNVPLGRRSCFLYASGTATFLVGNADARYRQSDIFAGSLVDTNWDSARISPVLDAELGTGWRLGRLQFRVGYLVNAWFNTVRTSDYINAVQTNSPDDLGSTISFDGLMARAQLTF